MIKIFKNNKISWFFIYLFICLFIYIYLIYLFYIFIFNIKLNSSSKKILQNSKSENPQNKDSQETQL